MQQLQTAAYRGSIFETTAKARGFQVFQTTDPAHSARMLVAGRVKLWVEGNVVVSNVLKEQGLPPGTVERVATLDRLSLYLAFSPNVSRETILRWEKALSDIKQDGSFAAIHQHWFPLDPVPMNVERTMTKLVGYGQLGLALHHRLRQILPALVHELPMQQTLCCKAVEQNNGRRDHNDMQIKPALERGLHAASRVRKR